MAGPGYHCQFCLGVDPGQTGCEFPLGWELSEVGVGLCATVPH